MRRKQPSMRSCVVCREKMEKRRLTRLVYTTEGLQMDPTGKAAGRGAYLCDQPMCWDKAATTTVLDKALRVSLTEHDRQRIREAAS